MRVQIPFSASWKGGPARYGTGLEIRQVDFYSRAGSNPVLSFYNKQDMSYEAHVFSVILFLLLEGHLLGEQSLLSQELLLVQKASNRLLRSLLPVWL